MNRPGSSSGERAGGHRARGPDVARRPDGRPKLMVLCGPSHSGKSTFAEKLGGRFRVINSDEIRRCFIHSLTPSECELEVWSIFDRLKHKALADGLNVILDACHMSERARRHSLQGPNRHHLKICIVFDLPLRVVRARCVRARRLSLKEVERMWRAFQQSKPTANQLMAEGFDEVRFVRGPRRRIWQGSSQPGRPDERDRR